MIVVGQGELGQYYDVQGSTWTDSPLLSDPSQEIHVGARTYSLFYDGEHVKTIAWREGDAAYWIENTLTYALSPQTMVAIARDTRRVGGPATPSRRRARARTAWRCRRRGSRLRRACSAKLEAALGFAILAAAAVLGIFLLVRQRELIRLREQVAQALELEARQRLRVARKLQ